MSERNRTDELTAGQEMAPSEFQVTREFNENYLHAIEDYHSRYMEETSAGPPIVHPSLLMNHSNNTRSPSFYLPPGMASVHAHEEFTYVNPGRVGSTFRVSWKVLETYERRGRPYHVVVALVVDEDEAPVLQRKTTYTYTGGSHPGA